jgi:hypothetical protein
MVSIYSMDPRVIAVTAFLLITTAAFSGCSTFQTSVKAGDFGDASSGDTGSALQPGTVVRGTDVLRTDPLATYRVEYRTTNNFGGRENVGTMILENSPGDYRGSPAIHFRMTNNFGSSGTVTDTYYDTKRTVVLGETVTWVHNGVADRTEDVSREELQKRKVSDEDEALFTYAGTETVTVPLGTFPAARKFTVQQEDGTDTFWVVEGIPMPVKDLYRSSAGYEYRKEMVGWG